MPSAVEYLIKAQHKNGGWGYHTGHMPVVEPSAAVLLAIREEAYARELFQRGMDWLLNSQHPDGGWGINENDPESGWQTTWAIIAMKRTKQSPQAISRAVAWLTTVATYDIPKEGFQKAEVPQTDIVGALVWPWLPGQATWIQPTALALLALEGIDGSPVAQARMNAATRYFEYYRTTMGGWSVGNTTKLDINDTARAFPTALVLMALANFTPGLIQPPDLTALQQDMQNDPGVLAQAAGLLALRMLGKVDDTSIARLSSQQEADGSWEHNPFATGLAMMAMRGYL